MNLEILPLAITMMAGPQIISAIIFVTSDRAVPVSLAFVSGVAIAIAIGVAIATGLASLLGDSASLGDDSTTGSTGTIIQIALVASSSPGRSRTTSVARRSSSPSGSASSRRPTRNRPSARAFW